MTPLNRADVSAPAPPTEPFSAHASPNTVVTEEMPSAQDRARGPESAGPNTRTGTPAASATAADGLRSATTTDVLGPVEADEPRSAGRVSGSCAPTESFATPIPDTPSSSAITAAVPMDPTSGFVDEVEIASTLAWLNAVSGVEGSYLLGLTANATGRSAAADVVIASDTASKHHCTITNDEQQVVVTAEPTPNGTYVNHVQIAPHRPVALHTGNILGLGRGIHLQVFIPEVERDITHLKFRSAGWSDIGGRSHNEDAFHDGDHVIAVADGVGGRPAGEQAAWLAVQGVRGARGTVDLSRAVHAINTQIRDHGDAEPRTSGLASTLDAAVLSAQSGTPWVHGVHVGDGIALLQRPRRAEIVWLTRAHTLAAEMRTASPGPLALAPEAHPQAGQLMRAVGFAEEVQPDEWQEQAEEGQRYLLASDGLISVLGEPGLRQALSELRAADPTACARTLIARAIDAGADDNVTVVIADVVPDTDVEAPTKRSVPPRRELRRGQP